LSPLFSNHFRKSRVLIDVVLHHCDGVVDKHFSELSLSINPVIGKLLQFRLILEHLIANQLLGVLELLDIEFW
jgi:hypothetical protein